jgi:hypothetical protein
MKQQYYHLVASLPELFFKPDAAKEFNFLNIRDYIIECISDKDAGYVNELLSVNDNYNLLSALFGKNREWKKGGALTKQTIADLSAEDRDDDGNPVILPPYIASFMEYFRQYAVENKDKPSYEDAERELNIVHYNTMQMSRNRFIAKWFRYDREIRNVQAAFVARQTGKDAENYLIDNDDITELLLKSASHDFGLLKERDYMPKLLQTLDIADLLEREAALSAFRWNLIDEINTFEYFSIDAVLGVLQKAFILDRWAGLDSAAGNEIFEKLLRTLKTAPAVIQ